MLKFLLQKIRQKKWMFIGLLVGNLLLVSVTAAGPMYAEAILQRTLTQDLHQVLLSTNEYPGTMQIRNKSYVSVGMNNVKNYEATVQRMVQELNVPVLTHNTRYGIGRLEAAILSQNKTVELELAAYTELADHIELVQGKLYTENLDVSGAVEVIVNQRTFAEQGLALGDVIQIPDLRDTAKTPIRLRVTGVFQHKDAQDLYWPTSPEIWSNIYIMDPALFQTLLADGSYSSGKTPYGEWHIVLDYTKMSTTRVEEIAEITHRYLEDFESKGTFRPSIIGFQETLEAFTTDAKRLNSTILVLQAPIFVLLAVFIFMVSKQILESEQNEISVFKSRGASKWQILWMYLQQSALVALISVTGGLPLSLLICKLLGGTNDFLSFVQRTALPARISGKIVLYTLAAAAVSVCTMVIPVIRYAGITIVDHKRKKSRRKTIKWWKLLGLDAILLSVSLYELHRYREQEAYLAEKFSAGAALDPVLYFCSAVFMLGASLLFLRLLPLLIRLIFRLGKRFWSPAIYASLLRIIRSNDNQGFMIVFLVMAIILGIFSTQMARTINLNAEEELQYAIGADVVLQEQWDERWIGSTGELAEDFSGSITTVPIEPDFEKYKTIDGVEVATKVLVDQKALITTDNGIVENTLLMGIHTKEFGQVAWFKDGLLSSHWYTYLNAISQNPNAILVSENLREKYGYALGDLLTYRNQAGNTAQGVIYGFVDYWPTYGSVTRTLGSDGLYTETDQFLIVAHLSKLQDQWGVTPYQIWMKLSGSSQVVYDFAEQTGTRFVSFQDTAAERIALKNDPMFQGTNGMLTIGFIIVLLLCCIGFLLYWILSIQSRTLQFGIFRAMGMSKGNVLSMLLVEQIFVSGTSIGAGILAGWLTSRLYIPLIQVAYAGVDKLLPLVNVMYPGDYVRLGTVIGIMLISCIVILGLRISKIRIAQALKLGED